MSYAEEDFLQLSGIQHFAFCRRQWALIYIENQWAENVRTAEGHLLHERANEVRTRHGAFKCFIRTNNRPYCSALNTISLQVK